MTNPNNALGTNGAYGGRTSVDALNDVLSTYKSRGVLSGFICAAKSGMTVTVGGTANIRDVAIAEDAVGNKTTINNISGTTVDVTVDTASTTSDRIDAIVAYVNNPATVGTTTLDNPEAVGIISVNGTSVAPSEAAIRSAITADGGTGTTAYYVVLAIISVPMNTTTITNSLITQGDGLELTDNAMITSQNIDSAILEIPNSYSTTETKIGKWIDGSDLYRVVYRTTSYTTNIDIPISGTATQITKADAVIQRSDYPEIFMPMPARVDNASFKAFFLTTSVALNNINVQFTLGTSWPTSFKSLVVIIEYTK